MFISYRTDDTGDVAAGLARLLREDLGGEAVFRDRDDLVAGQPWEDSLVTAIDSSDAVVVLIGQDWEGPPAGPRLVESDRDPVRREVEQALSAPERRTVVPVRVDGVATPKGPPDFIDQLRRLHAPAVDRADLSRPESRDYQSVLVGIWAGLAEQHQDSILIMGDTSPVAQARISEVVQEIRRSSPGQVHEISRFASGAAIVTVRQARRAAKKWPDAIVVVDDPQHSAVVSARLAAARGHPALSAVALVGTGAIAGAATTAGLASYGTISQLVASVGDAAGATATGSGSASLVQRALDVIQARPRIAWIAGIGGAAAAGAAGVAVLAAGPSLLDQVPGDGLVAAYSAAEGVESDVDAGVTTWTDLVSGRTLEVVPPEEPGPAPVARTSRPEGVAVVTFPGGGAPAMAGNAEGLPQGSADRTVVVAAQWNGFCCEQVEDILGAGWGDPAQLVGRGDDPEQRASFFVGSVHYNCFGMNLAGVSIGLGSDAGFCGGRGSPDDELLTDQTVLERGLTSVAARHTDGQLTIFLDGRDQQTGEYSFNTRGDQFWIGTWPNWKYSGAVDVMAVLVYDRALDDDEVAAVQEGLESFAGEDWGQTVPAAG